jgi:4-hydroxybenzoate polyprenyltransferase
VKSLAITWGDNTKRNSHLLLALMQATLSVGGALNSFHMSYYAMLALGWGWYGWKIRGVNLEDRSNCWDFFVWNKWYGLYILLAIMAGRCLMNEPTPQ